MRLATRFARNMNRISARPGSHLIEEQLRSAVPSVFADGAHASRSAKYVYVPTVEIVRKMVSENFLPVFACQANPRDEGKHGHTKHMIRFRQGGADLAKPETPEIILVNSHDGTTSYQLLAGIFRALCTNGMIAGEQFDEVRVHHKGNIIDGVLEGAFTVVNHFERVLGSVDTMKQIELKPDEARILAESAAMVRFEPDENEALPMSAERLLEPRRIEDRQPDLWTTLNRLQENVIRGGQRFVARNANGVRRRSSTREVKGIDQNVKLNRALWTLAEKMAELKRS